MDRGRCSRPLSGDLQYHNFRLSNPSPYSNQVHTHTRESWREPNIAPQCSSSSSSYRHHPSSQPPSSSSSSNSSWGREARLPPSNSDRSSYLASPPLVPYITPSTGPFAPPLHEQPQSSDERHPMLRVDGRSSAFAQFSPQEHGVTAAKGGSHRFPPLQSALRSYYEDIPFSRNTRKAYSNSQTPTMMQLSKFNTVEPKDVNTGLLPHEMEVSSEGFQSELVTSSISQRATGEARPDSLASTSNQPIQQAPAAYSLHSFQRRSRSLSQSSQHSQNSHFSRESRRSSHSQAEPISREYSVSSNESGHAAGSTAPSEDLYSKKTHFSRKSRGGEKKKRTRALMTHLQQAGLMRLWKKNQRQKSRKTLMENGGVPEGEDPADYEDLQKSPRSRRLSMDREEKVIPSIGASGGPSGMAYDRKGVNIGPESEGQNLAYDSPTSDRDPLNELSNRRSMSPHGWSRYERGAVSYPPHNVTSSNPYQSPGPLRPHTYPYHHPPPFPSTIPGHHAQYPSVSQSPRSATGSFSFGDLHYSHIPFDASALGGSCRRTSVGMLDSQASMVSQSFEPPPTRMQQRSARSYYRRRSVSPEHLKTIGLPTGMPPSIPITTSCATFMHDADTPPFTGLANTCSSPAEYSTRPRADTWLGLPPSRQHLNTSHTTDAVASHLPPTLARVAISGPVEGGEELPAIARGMGDDVNPQSFITREEAGSPRKRSSFWRAESRRVRTRGREVEGGKEDSRHLGH
ncbi:Hypothetical protein CGB_K2020C [Cryptococcus gattii WM276]|uniref:Uncharacterized protein n=2 Tax=Cryptococcus gattii TaxID=37769 RepID=E6RDH7_CRYGW|nr:Hypothetical protein CGB_K2020C [Cryptococcus gattii WM276]ADV24953.1 Hypothetical protein CGB_K2020C [Cryptococcus gattii WM276]KIR79213.1 hypothetical protein I306_03774 [Cryptococcus gattii EJB2]